MSKYLIKVTEQYRCDTEEEARKLIEDAKKSYQYTLTKSSSEIKTQKQKGEIVDEWRRVVLTKEFTAEKEPLEQMFVHYSNQEDEDE